ncbi:MAG: hypothetical protein H6739_21760 [Alphaproteobacteria bacterium]|nr:hypothetical protein [Alphaproteobacteria bacterium]
MSPETLALALGLPALIAGGLARVGRPAVGLALAFTVGAWWVTGALAWPPVSATQKLCWLGLPAAALGWLGGRLPWRVRVGGLALALGLVAAWLFHRALGRLAPVEASAHLGLGLGMQVLAVAGAWRGAAGVGGRRALAGAALGAAGLGLGLALTGNLILGLLCFVVGAALGGVMALGGGPAPPLAAGALALASWAAAVGSVYGELPVVAAGLLLAVPLPLGQGWRRVALRGAAWVAGVGVCALAGG